MPRSLGGLSPFGKAIVLTKRSPRTSRRLDKANASEVPPSGPNPREVNLPQLSPWTLACAHPPDAWRLSLVFVSVLCVGGFRPPVCAAPGLPGRDATSSLLLSNIFFQLLYGVVLWWSTLHCRREGNIRDENQEPLRHH